MSDPLPDSTVRVRFFGPVRSRVDAEFCDIPCAGEISPDELWTQLLKRHPALKPLRPTIRLASNGDFLHDNEMMRAGGEIALIPPVSGG